MSDAMVPSYRVQRDPSGVPWRMLAAAGGMLAIVAAGAGGWWAFQRMGARGVPVVEADPRPFKVRPDDRGGLRVPNQDELVLERPGHRQSPAQAGRPAAVAPGAEAPDIERLRATVAPPPVVAPVTPPARPAANGAAPAQQVARTGQPPAATPPAPAATPATPTQAPPPAAVAALPPTRPAATGRVMVQLAAVPSEEAARGEWNRLARRAPDLLQGRSPAISKLEREGQATLYRLRAGGFADQDTAKQFCEQLRAKGAACIPIR